MCKKLIMAIALCLSLLLMKEVDAEIFIVNSTADVIDGGCSDMMGDNLCTLREAIIEANANGVPDEIHLEAETYKIAIPSGVETLDVNEEDKGDFDITENTELRIIGPSDSLATISGNNMERVFHIGGDLFSDVIVSFENVRITEGLLENSHSGSASGAGIFATNNADLTMINTEVIANRNLKTDQSDGFTLGGGIYLGMMSTLDMSSSLVANNEVVRNHGGGIAISGGGGTIDNSTISGNNAEDGNGGGIAGHSGVTVIRSTITNNTASGDGGGISGGVNIKNTIVAGNNPASPLDNNDDVSISIISLGYNIIGVASSNVETATGDQIGTSGQFGTEVNPVVPLLGPLSNNGGLTLTHLPLPGSPAISTADPADCSGTDQRGEPRPFPGTNCDIGAAELQSNCGDGVPDADEACDLGVDNGLPELDCSSTCQTKDPGTADPKCGNGQVDTPEECDDGNNIDDDLCSNLCLNVATNPPGNEGSGGCAISTSDDFNYFYLAAISIILGWVIVRSRIVKQHGGNETR